MHLDTHSGLSASSTNLGAAFEPTPEQRRALLDHVADLVEAHRDHVHELPVTPTIDAADLRSRLGAYRFTEPLDPHTVLDDVADLLRDGSVHTTHPGYLGLFNPNPAFVGILADTLAATFNPQLAAWSHAPAAVETELHVLRYLGQRLGLESDAVAGSFTSGGAEANHTAALLGLTRMYPDFAGRGIRALPAQPLLYASTESHLAWLKIAHACGLGRDAVRLVPVTSDLRMDVDALAAMISTDRRAGGSPFLIVGTAGTTSAGAIDPLPQLAELAAAEGLRLHIDAAWAGAAALSDRLRPLLTGVECADSITIDSHKWLSVPMGAGSFLCTDAEGLAQTFHVSTAYMPSATTDTIDPYASSTQWSRRFTGLKLFLTLAVAGRNGYARALEHQVAMGDALRGRLLSAGWTVVNNTVLPLVCFTDQPESAESSERRAARLHAIAEDVVRAGHSWISPVRLAGQPALRACVTNFATTVDDLDDLVATLQTARERNPACG